MFYLERHHELDKRYREVESANQELKQLNGQLEKDLLSVGGVSALFRRGPEVRRIEEVRIGLIHWHMFSSFRVKQVIVIVMKQKSLKMS